MVNFLATLLKDLQKILIPIYNLTRKCIKFLWTEECQKAFDHIKFLLSNPPILRMPDMTGIFRLMSDTSTLAAGAALYQYQGSAFYIVGYNSKKLPKAVQNYSVTELELFGLVVNIYAFKQLLTNVYFEVFCDHSAIVQILNGKKKLPTRRIQRLIEHLLPFNFTVQYLPGNKMHIADILSRLAGKDLKPSDQLIPISFNVHTRSTRPLKQYYVNKQKTSIPYKNIIPKATHTTPIIPPAQVKGPPKISIQLPKPAKCLLVIPEKFENTIFHMFHDTLLGAHYGPVNTYYTIKDRYWIHNMFEKLQRYISSCEACQQQKQKRGKIPYSHPRIPLSYNPMSYISADIKYMPKGIYDYEFLLIAVCEITGFVIAIPLIKHDAVSIAHALIDRIFLIFGPPKSLIVDEDRALSSKVMHYVLDALKIDIKCISPYNHGSLKTERYIQTINNLITRHLKDKGKEWPLFVTSCCFAMNTFVSTTTGFSPYELVFLKKPPDILNLYFEPLETIAKGYRDYCLKMRAKLDNVSSFILELKTFQQQRQSLE